MEAYSWKMNGEHIKISGKNLKDSEGAFTVVAKRSKDGIFIETPDGKTVYCNKAVEALSGYSVEDIKQYGWFNLVFPNEEQRSKVAKLAEQASFGEDICIVTPIKRKDGSKVWVSLSLTPIDINGKNYNLGVATDITERIKTKEELYKAREFSDALQEALLTVPEHLPGIDFGHLYRSSTEATLVGGDFYDLFELEHGRIGIVIGDVSGKGLEAAVFTTVIKNTIKAYAYESSSPASIIARTNDLIHRLTPDYIFVTLFYGMLETATGRLSYCSAGHPPAIIKMSSSEVKLLSTRSPIIGAMRDLTFVDEEIMLKKGDILIGYTDGAIEARCNSHLFGEDKLVSFIEGIDNFNIADLPLLIYSEIMGFTGGKLSDDLAILCLTRSA